MPVVALGAVAFVFRGGQTIVTLLLLGYALVTQLFPALVLGLVRPGLVSRWGAMAGIVAGVGARRRRCPSRARRRGRRPTVDSFIGGLPSFVAQLNLGVVALVVNVVVTLAVSAIAPSTPRDTATGRFQRATEGARIGI